MPVATGCFYGQEKEVIIGKERKDESVSDLRLQHLRLMNGCTGNGNKCGSSFRSNNEKYREKQEQKTRAVGREDTCRSRSLQQTCWRLGPLCLISNTRQWCTLIKSFTKARCRGRALTALKVLVFELAPPALCVGW